MKTFNHTYVNNFILLYLLAAIVLFIFPFNTAFATISISLFPQNSILQGEPVLIQISVVKISEINKLTFNNQTLKLFDYNNLPSSLLGIDLNQKAGDYKIKLKLKNGSSTEEILTVKEREKYQTYLAVPDKLGGNSTSSQIKVSNTLAQENAYLAVLKTFAKKLWADCYIYPVAKPIVTANYGFSRTSGVSVITHKGVDFKAKQGDKIFAINKGIVRVAKTFQVYGKTVVIDHGMGLMSFYLHLSKINVNQGELVKQGRVIGSAGSTGFSTGPHLHFSVRINNVSIDPVKFLDLFN